MTSFLITTGYYLYLPRILFLLLKIEDEPDERFHNRVYSISTGVNFMLYHDNLNDICIIFPTHYS